MAQAAMAIQMDVAVGITVMPEALAIQTAMKMLKNYKELVKEINARENAGKATGKRFLDKYQMQLAAVGKQYVQKPEGYIYKEKFERVFGEQADAAEAAGNHEDAEALGELETYMIGTKAWAEVDEDGYVSASGTDWKGHIVTFGREYQLRREEMGDLLDERDFIDMTILAMRAYKYEKEAFILENQYMAKRKVAKVMEMMIEKELAQEGLADSTYHAWRKEALKIFAKLAGLC